MSITLIWVTAGSCARKQIIMSLCLTVGTMTIIIMADTFFLGTLDKIELMTVRIGVTDVEYTR